MARFIFITGGVVSSLGKGLSAASLGALLQSHGYTVKLRKLDPYLNVDPGTMNPIQHGEVFVTDDGAETDLDLGHYERFTDVSASKFDNITSGKIYQNIISKERKGDYLGGTVQVIPHVTDAIKDFILNLTEDVDFLLCEIGGTVGDIEALPFFEAIRQLRNELESNSCLFMHLTLLPFIAAAGELKTKPTQHSVKELTSIGIQPDIIILRCDRDIPDDERKKISSFCNVPFSRIIPAVDVGNIYDVPMHLHNNGLDKEVLKIFNIYDDKSKPNFEKWDQISLNSSSLEDTVNITIVGKYIQLKDAYKSLDEAIYHGGLINKVKVNVEWLDSELLENSDPINYLNKTDAILIPGGFGKRGSKGKINAIRFARERKIPLLGICFGMQMAIVELSQNLLKLKQANTTEFGDTSEPVVDLMTEWKKGQEIEKRDVNTNLGGTMRLGAYEAILKKGTRAHKIYNKNIISERHRHRWEVNIKYKEQLEKVGVVFSGISPDGKLPEIIELEGHPWFVGVQFHPELKSRPFHPHPIFISYILAALEKSRLV
ncbi:MAG: CTP synthase [Hyphomicrobiales bacterium]|nr:CTP synthase [Hyphomicrobiales bacterium]|tara:strand:- start:909 stop:2540 length:1632 start_codon:yes stop_codon:yes gene_type:complete